ncbi:MAG: MFS transporter [Bacilli bacterium]|jgi:MFS family permease|nr:MFS transporter [Bacilli bacterium]
MNKKIFLLSIADCLYYFALGAFFPFNSIYLQETLHYTNFQTGLFYAFGSIICIISVPLIGMIADKIKHPKKVFIINALMVFGLLIAYAFCRPFIIMVSLYILINGLRTSLIPLSDSITLDYCEVYHLNYGIIRSLGSLAYIMASIIMGFVVGHYLNYPNLFIIVHFIFIGLAALFMAFVPNIYRNNSKKNTFKKDYQELIQDKQYLIIIIIMAIAYAIIQVSQVFVPLSITYLHGDSVIVGYSFLFMVIFEVLLMGPAIKISQKIPHIYLMLLAFISLVIRWIILIVSNSILWILIASLAHGLVMALCIIVGFDLIKKLVKPNLVTSALSLYSGLSNVFFTIISLIIGIITLNNINNGNYLYLITTIIGLFVIIYYIKCYERN